MARAVPLKSTASTGGEERRDDEEEEDIRGAGGKTKGKTSAAEMSSIQVRGGRRTGRLGSKNNLVR